MPRCTTSTRACVLLALLAATTVTAQDLPNLNTATEPGATPTSTSAAASTTDSTSATSAATSATDSTTASSSSSSERTSASTTNAATTDTTATSTATFPDVTTTTTSSGTVVQLLTGLPTIAGAGIPTMIIPYTANAPFMQKSDVPEGTVFIAVGAVLAALGACVLLWRGLVAWSINRSVKRSATAAMLGSDRNPRWNGGGGTVGSKSGYYKEYDMGSTMSLDALNSNGKPIRHTTVPDEGKRQPSAPPAGLFFSPTARGSTRLSSANMDNRSSTYLPAGYYASPSADVAGGRGSTVIGSSLAPYARNSTVNPSPPGSPLPNSRSTSSYYAGGVPRGTSRDGFRNHDGMRNSSREGLRAPPSRDGYSSQRNSSVLHHQPSTNSLGVGPRAASTHGSHEYLGGQRAPSAVLDELFENHGNGPRERF